jgi:hypothetical protein
VGYFSKCVGNNVGQIGAKRAKNEFQQTDLSTTEFSSNDLNTFLHRDLPTYLGFGRV